MSPRRPLTRERIVAAAIALADDEGIAAVSMRKVGGRLGVEAMSLYHHVSGKDDLLDGMVDAVVGEFERPAPDEPWRAAMTRRSFSARSALARHPWAVGLMDSRSSPGLGTLRHHESMLASLRGAGFSVAGAAHAFALLDSFLFGFALQERNLPFEGDEQLADLAGSIVDALPADEFPYMIEIATQHVLADGYDFGDEFTYGLELVLDGLERALADERQSSAGSSASPSVDRS